MRPAALCLVAPIAGWLAACAGTPTGSERIVIAEGESKLRFDLSDARPMRSTYFKTQPRNYSGLGYILVWQQSQAPDPFPHARIEYFETNMSYYFQTEGDPRDYVKGLNFGQLGAVEPGALVRNKNRFGSVETMRFAVGNSSCFAFAQTVGMSTSPGAGKNRISGHYCGGSYGPLTDDRIGEVLGSIRITE